MMQTAESRIVFLTVAPAKNRDHLGTILRESVDWATVVHLGTMQKAMPAIARFLADAPEQVSAQLPPDLLTQFRRQRMVSEMHMLHLQERTKEALRALQSAGVPVLLLKGGALGASVYPSFVARPMADVDMLVKPEHLESAAKMLVESGWHPEPDAARAALYAGHHHLAPFHDSKGSGHRIEVHTSPMPAGSPFADVAGEMWRDAVSARPDFAGALVPSRVHMLVHACSHYAWSHMMFNGAWRTFHDINTLTADGSLWNEMATVAERWKAASCCYWALRMAEQTTRLEVPAPLLARLRPPIARWQEEFLLKHFVAQFNGRGGSGGPNGNGDAGRDGSAPGCPSVMLGGWLWRAAVRPRWSGHGASLPEQDVDKWLGHEGVPRIEWTQLLRTAAASSRYLLSLAAAQRIR